MLLLAVYFTIIPAPQHGLDPQPSRQTDHQIEQLVVPGGFPFEIGMSDATAYRFLVHA